MRPFTALRPFHPRAASPRPLSHTLDRIAILNNSAHTPGRRSDLTALLAAHWQENGIEVIELPGTGTFVEADLLFLNLSRPLLPETYLRFAAQYPVTFNAGASDLRKHRYADGLLKAGDAFGGPVIVKSDFAQPASTGTYRIHASLKDVPPEQFGPGHIVQKFLPEVAGSHYVLRQYYFLGESHFLSLQTSSAAIIRTSTPQSLEEWTPPPPLLALRQRLGLDYGRITFVEVDGQPFVLSVSRSPSLPARTGAGHLPPAYHRLSSSLAAALVESYRTTEKAVF